MMVMIIILITRNPSGAEPVPGEELATNKKPVSYVNTKFRAPAPLASTLDKLLNDTNKF